MSERVLVDGEMYNIRAENPDAIHISPEGRPEIYNALVYRDGEWSVFGDSRSHRIVFEESIETVAPEMVQEILKNLSYSEALQFCLSNRQFQSYCRNWAEVLRLKYPEENWRGITNREAIAIDQALENPTQNALMNVVERGNLDWVKYIIDHSANRFYLDRVFIGASKYGHLDIMKWLAERRGVNSKVYGIPAFIEASENGHLDVLKWLIEYSNVNPNMDEAFIRASENGHLNVLKWLIEQPGVDPAAQSNEAFIRASENGHLDVLKWLIEQPGVDPAARDSTAFIMASRYGHLDVLKWLIEQPGVDPSSLNNEAFFWASVKGELEVVKWLVEQSGVDPSVRMNEILPLMDEDLVDWFSELIRSQPAF